MRLKNLFLRIESLFTKIDARAKLINYLNDRSNLIKSYTGIEDYINLGDITEVESWSKYKCVKILSKIGGSGDTKNCPWCILNGFGNCENCGYGKRHGICLRSNSTYRTICEKIGEINAKNDVKTIDCISSIPGMLLLTTSFNWRLLKSRLKQQ